MNLPKVKENLTHLSTAGAPRITLDEVVATKLGIEAINFVLTTRAWSEGKFPPPLSGETEE